MPNVAERLKLLRENLQISQKKIAELIGTNQPAITRYESGNSFPPEHILMWYADYFDVSMDYIFGRTDNPEGKLYSYQPEAIRKKTENNEELRQFVEMCFDPNSSMNNKLKETLVRMLQEGQK